MKFNLQLKYTQWISTKGRYGWENNNPLRITHYRIWLMTNGLEWWQRHEWRYEDKPDWKDEWIISAYRKFPEHYIELLEEDENYE